MKTCKCPDRLEEIYHGGGRVGKECKGDCPIEECFHYQRHQNNYLNRKTKSMQIFRTAVQVFNAFIFGVFGLSAVIGLVVILEYLTQ